MSAIIYAGSPQIENCQFIGFATAARATSDYSDMPVFRRIAALECCDGGENRWVLDHGTGMGEGGIVEQCMFLGAGDPAQGGATRRARAIRLHNRRGWAIRQIVNGDILISMCGATELTGLYMERGLTRIENSRGTRLKDSVFFQRDTGMQAITPLAISDRRAEPKRPTGGHGGRAENVGFIYDPLGQQVPWTQPPTPGNFDRRGRANFTIAGAGHWSFRNLYREFSPGDYGRQSLTGVTCGQPAFDDQSHIASTASQYAAGRWIIAGELPTLAGADLAVGGSDGYLPFTGPAGEYRYAAQFLFDKNRRVGVAARGGVRASCSGGGRFGGGGAPVLALTLPGPAMVRLYRGGPGLREGHFDRVVEVPAFGSLTLYDLGATLNERAWVARTSGPVDSITPAESFALSPGDVGAGGAYGSTRCRIAAPGAPQAGAWRTGDTVELAWPVLSVHAGLQLALTGFRRLTDGNGHAAGRDWMPMHAIVGPAPSQAGVFAQRTNG